MRKVGSLFCLVAGIASGLGAMVLSMVFVVYVIRETWQEAAISMAMVLVLCVITCKCFDKVFPYRAGR